MSSIITSILSSTVGLLWNKARDKTAAKLRDGDITDAKIREIVVRDLNDIKTKLDGLSRKDLLSSYSFLKEGVDLLNVSLDKSEEKTVLNEAQDDRDAPETLRMPSGVESGILTEALELSDAMRKLKINSEKEIDSTKRRFEHARTKATEAFCNESLVIEDRIFAAKLRIVSEIVECLETPETAITGCLSFLRDLHSLPAIREMFSVYLNGGLKSRLNKAERTENVKSVMLINYVLFQFAFKFSGKFCSPHAWPTIELASRSFHPILHWQEIPTRKSMGDGLLQPPKYEVLFDEEINPYLSAVNSHFEVVVMHGNNIKVISKTGESRVVKLPDLRERKVIQQHIVTLAVDKNNNIYVVKRLEVSCRKFHGVVENFVLYVLDKNYNAKHERTLDFLEATTSYYMRIAVNKNNNIIMIKQVDPHVYVCDNTGQFKYKFERDSSWAFSLSISDKNEIMIPSNDDQNVHIYTEEGDATKSSIEVPSDKWHEVRAVAFHHLISKIIVLTYFRKEDSYVLLYYSETGELERSTFFGKRIDGECGPNITSHPSGLVAFVRPRSVTFI